MHSRSPRLGMVKIWIILFYHITIVCLNWKKKKNSRGDGAPRQAAVPGFYMLHEFSTITSDIEVLCTTKNTNVFTVLYRPPCDIILTFLKFLDSSLSCTNENKWLLTRGGDMNIDVQKGSSSANDFCLS